jgi:hypothetical protein
VRSDHAEFGVEWVTDTFGLGRPVAARLAGRGQRNPLGVLRLETSTGVFAIKRFRDEPRPFALAIESAAHAAGFPMPRPVGPPYAVCHQDGRAVWVRVYSWVDGSAYEWGVVDVRLSARVGGLLAALHALPVAPVALAEEPWRPLGGATWAALAAAAGRRRLGWASTLHSMLSVLVQWEDRVLAWTACDEPLVPSQRDLHPPNLIACPYGRQVVVDWDAAGPMNAREDVAKWAVVWASPPGAAPVREAVRAFVAGYRAAGGRFVSRGLRDLTHHVRSLLWWTGYNIGRDLGDDPGPDPDLTPALLSEVRRLDLDVLKRTAAYLAER